MHFNVIHNNTKYRIKCYLNTGPVKMTEPWSTVTPTLAQSRLLSLYLLPGVCHGVKLKQLHQMAGTINSSFGGCVIQWCCFWVIPKITGVFRVLAPFSRLDFYLKTDPQSRGYSYEDSVRGLIGESRGCTRRASPLGSWSPLQEILDPPLGLCRLSRRESLLSFSEEVTFFPFVLFLSYFHFPLK